MVKTAPGKMDRRSHQPEKDGSSGSGSRFKGIRMRKWGKWVAEVRLPNSRERIWLGSYNTPEQAARAYDAAVFCLRGPAATFNFPETPPDIPSAGTLNQIQIQAAAARYARAGSSSVEGGDSTMQHPMENQSPSATTVESLLSGDNWAFTEAFQLDSIHAERDMGHFSSLGEFPAEHFIPAEEDDDETASGEFFQSPCLWSF